MEELSIIIAAPLLVELCCVMVLMAIFLFRWKPETINDDLPLVTVFVPFYNEDKALLLTALDKIDQQEYSSRLQVLIIDDGSTNDTPDFVYQWLQQERKQSYVILNKPENTGRKGAALDFALEQQVATGEIYIVVDSDTFIEPGGDSRSG